VHVKVLTFRLSEEDRSDEAYASFVRALGQTNVLALRGHGLLDGYVVRIAEDKILTINFYESKEHADAGFAEITGTAEYAKRMKLELLDQLEGPAIDLPLSYSESDSR
jgi:hypothetical protein